MTTRPPAPPPKPPRGKNWRFRREFRAAGWFGELRRRQANTNK